MLNRQEETDTWARGTRPEVYWDTDFTKVKPGKYGYKYLLFFVDIFSGWTEAFPTKHETAYVVTYKVPEKILPRFSVPHMTGSDNGPAFISQVNQGIAAALEAEWTLHCV